MVAPLAALALGAQAFSTIGGHILGRKSKRKEKRAQRKAEQAAKESLARRRASLEAEFPRQQALLRQRLAGRGLLDSTIADTDLKRLQRMQADAMASLSGQEQQLRANIQLSKARRRQERAGEIFGLVGQAGSLVGGLSDILGRQQKPPPMEEEGFSFFKSLF